MDRRRKKKGSNEEWVNPYDPEAEITRLKNGRTALAYKAEHAVDMDTGAIVAVTTHGGYVRSVILTDERFLHFQLRQDMRRRRRRV
jgi:hypothetical protein